MTDSVVTGPMAVYQVKAAETHSVDALIQTACVQNRVPPVYRYLMALYDLDGKAYLGAHETVGGDGKKHELQLRIRFHPIRAELLEEPNTLNLYYHQMLYHVLNEFKMKEYSHELVSKLVGFVAMDYVRQLIEKNETPTDEKTAELLNSKTLPASWKFPWWKKKVVKKDFIQCVNQFYSECKLDPSIMKTAFIDAVHELLLGSRQEEFEARILRNGVTYDAQVIVGHLSCGTREAEAGPFLKIFQETMAGDIFPMAQMSYLLPLDANTVEIHIRDEQPIIMLLSERNSVELCTLLDGYYRMTERFTGCLCREFLPPSIALLKERKIHGPIRKSIAQKKLSDNKKSTGCYLVRQDQLAHGLYQVDTLSADDRHETHAISETKEGQFRMMSFLEEQDCYESLDALISSKITRIKQMCKLVPSDRDKTGLQMCREVPAQDPAQDGEPDAKLINLKKFRPELPMLRDTCQQQRLLKGTYEGSAVVVRVLLGDDPAMIKRFLRKASEVSLWRSHLFVTVVGLSVAPHVCLASAFMPLGSLDEYLKRSEECLSVFDLACAALSLAKALWYLEENEFAHGRVRCRSAFVTERRHGRFTVKLGEPGLPIYSDQDVPWIAPEYLSNMEAVAYSQKADIYAFGTTLWEIFNRGRSPTDVVSEKQAKEFLTSDTHLTLAAVPEEFCPIISGCWDRDADKRIPPDELVRNINKVLHKLETIPDTDSDSQANDTPAPTAYLSANASKTKAAQLPALRHVAKEQSSNLQRRNSAASQSSIASRKAWKANNLLKFFLKRDTEYETLSSISSIAPSQHTVDTEVSDDNRWNDESFEEATDEGVDEPSNIVNWDLQRSDLKLEDPIGQGFFGMVFKAVLTKPSGMKEIVAVKKMKSTVADICNKDLEREIDIMKRLRHPNIVAILGSNDEDGLMLVMEFVGMGALSAYLMANRRKLSTKELMKFSQDVASAMAYLERKKVIHRDLAARNILVKSESCVKLSDFGLAHDLSKEYYTVENMSRDLPIKWYAPESILFNKFSIKSDVWSYGVVLWEIFTFGSVPTFKSEDPAALGQSLLDGYRLPFPEDSPTDIRQIMRQCWDSDKNLRPTFATLYKKITGIMESMD